MKIFISPSIVVEIQAAIPPTAQSILTEDALRFVGLLCHKFEGRRKALLNNRETVALAYDSLEVPQFQKSGKISAGGWKCAPVPADVADRRVEITGPVDRKMVINGLNSGASVYMADFEDSTSPTWKNIIEGQQNLKDAVAGTITVNKQSGKVYRLNEETSTLFVRPRGWHLDEAHITVNGQSASGSIVDFALFFYHNIHLLMEKGTSSYFYLPKLETSLEARLWNDVFVAGKFHNYSISTTANANRNFFNYFYYLYLHSPKLPRSAKWNYSGNCPSRNNHSSL